LRQLPGRSAGGVHLCCTNWTEKRGFVMELAPIVVVVPHRHDKAEAIQRLKAAIEEAKARDAAKFKIAEERWEGDCLTFRIALLGLPCTGKIDIGEDAVRAEVQLSWYLGHMARAVEEFIRQRGSTILSSP